MGAIPQTRTTGPKSYPVAEAVTAGVGVESLLVRAAELGGTCRLESPPGGGTVVTARLPMEAW